MLSKEAQQATGGVSGILPGLSMLVKKTQFLEGTITAPPSKSYTHRAIVIGSMNGESKVNNYLDSDDTKNTIKVWRELGADIDINKSKKMLSIRGFKGCPKFEDGTVLNIGESGTLLRFALAVASLGHGEIVIDGTGTALTRSNNRIVSALNSLGAVIEGQGQTDTVPVTIKANGLKGEKITIRSDVTSQVISALLIALPLAEGNSKIRIQSPEKMVSRPYIEITRHVLEKVGIKTVNNNFESFEVEGGQRFGPLENFDVPGDYSSAAFLMAAASLIKSNVRIENLLEDDKQGDKEIINIINRMGGKIKKGKDYVEIEGPFDLEGIEVDCRDTPDIVPVIAALAVFAKGETHISNIAHLKEKESNRILSIEEEFKKLGIDIKITVNEILIKNSVPKTGVILDPHDDHRIAMCLSLIGLRTGDLTIENAKCIDKSYPEFITDMKALGANIELK